MTEQATGSVDEIEKIDGRERFRKEVALKSGESLNFGTVKKCRKIFTNVISGTIKFEIRGDYSSDMVCQTGFQGGPFSGGGGDFEPGTLQIRVMAPVDAYFHLNVEWEEGATITVTGRT